MGFIPLRRQTIKQPPQLPPILFIQPIIGVHPENPVPGGVPQAFVVRGGEVIHPWEIKHTGPDLFGQRARAIRGTGVHDDDFVRQPGHRTQAGGQVIFLVLDNHAQGNARLRVRRTPDLMLDLANFYATRLLANSPLLGSGLLTPPCSRLTKTSRATMMRSKPAAALGRTTPRS